MTFRTLRRVCFIVFAQWALVDAPHVGTPSGRVLARTKGGLEVDVSGIRAFLPASQADMRPLRNVDSLVGEEITCKVAKLDRKRSNVVVSRKAAMEEEFHRRRSQHRD